MGITCGSTAVVARSSSRRLLAHLCRSSAFVLTIPAASSAQELRYVVTSDYFTSSDHGQALAILGDVNLDGVLDFAVGEPNGGFISTSGRVRVLSGADGTQLCKVLSFSSYDRLGSCVAAVGDVDGDGIPDVAGGAVGADSPSGDQNAGKVVIASGSTGSTILTIYGPSADVELGTSVAGPGDVTGDGTPDILAGQYTGGAFTFSGVAYLFDGASGSVVYTFTGDFYEDRFGSSVGDVGDVDGDGVPDLAVGAPGGLGSPLPGYVRLFSGADGSVIRTLQDNTTDNDRFGTAIANVGDVDGDLVPDLLVGAPAADYPTVNHGAAWVFSGATGASLLRIDGHGDDSGFGDSVSPAGDVDGDGTVDLLVGAPNARYLTSKVTGAAWVHSGADGSELFALNGVSSGDRFGDAVAAGADLDGDGVVEVIVGAPGADTWGIGGEVWVYSTGTTGATSTFCSGKVNSLGCTPMISSTGIPSLTGPDDFHLHAESVISGQPTLFVWGLAPQWTPHWNGIFCVSQVKARTKVAFATGAVDPPTCNGTTDFHFTQSYMAQFGLVAGTTLYAQCWSRDPQHPDGYGVGLTEGLIFTIGR